MSAALKILACGRCEILPANQNGGAEFIQGRAEDCDSRNAGSATLYTYGIEENSIVYSLVYWIYPLHLAMKWNGDHLGSAM